MRYEHIKKATESWIDAFDNDPLQKYIRDTPDKRKPMPRTTRAVFATLMARWICRRLVLTVKGGDALVIATSAATTDKPDGADRTIDFILKLILSGSGYLKSREQRKRAAEYEAKVAALVKSTLGEKVKDMIHLNILATAPASQGLGYGGMLVDAIANLADEQGRAIYLFSSNVDNVPFYNMHGFVTVAQVELGVDNPTWHDHPVITPLMVRQPKMTEKDIYYD